MAGEPDFEYSLKILLIGDMAVGKTCLLRRFVDDQFRCGGGVPAFAFRAHDALHVPAHRAAAR